MQSGMEVLGVSEIGGDVLETSSESCAAGSWLCDVNWLFQINMCRLKSGNRGCFCLLSNVNVECLMTWLKDLEGAFVRTLQRCTTWPMNTNLACCRVCGMEASTALCWEGQAPMYRRDCGVAGVEHCSWTVCHD